MRIKKIFFVFFLILFFLVLIWKQDFFSIKKIEIISDADCVTEQELRNKLNAIDKSWLDIKSGRVENILKNKYLCIKNVDLSYQFPTTMKVKIFGRRFFTKVLPLDKTLNLQNFESSVSSETALIDWSFPQISDDILVADNRGFIYTKKPADFPLPLLFLSENLSLGKQLDIKKFILIEQIFERYSELDELIQQKSFKAKIDGNALFIEGSFKTAFSLKRDILKQLASLQLILQKARIDQRDAKVIDLRFDKLIIEY